MRNRTCSLQQWSLSDNRYTRFILCISLIFFASCIYVRAQSTDLKFEHISIEHGLSQSCVQCIFQDDQGFMWFGTENGLDRYDGYTFKVYWHDLGDSTSLSHNFIRDIEQDKNGYLWIATENGLNRFDKATEQFTRFKHDPDNSGSLGHDKIYGLYIDSQNNLWIGTDGGGLDKLDLDKSETYDSSFIHYRFDPNNTNCLSHNEVYSITENRDGFLWIATFGGISKLDPNREQFTSYRHDPAKKNSVSSDKVWFVEEDRDGLLWIGTYDRGLNRFDPQKEEFTIYQRDDQNHRSLNSNQIWAFCEDSSGDTWIGTLGGGLNKLNRQTGEFTHYYHNPDNPGSISHNEIACIYEDRAGTLWIGTFGGGINKIDKMRPAFPHYRANPDDSIGLTNPYISAFCQDPINENSLWIGTYGGGLYKLDRNMETWENFKHSPENPNSLSLDFISSIVSDNAGALWIGTLGGGVCQMLRTDGQIEWRRFRHPGSFYTPTTLNTVDNIIRNKRPVSAILQVGDSQELSKEFDIQEKSIVLFICQGEANYEMFDYGWIKKQNEMVWSMDFKQSRCAGGALKNRLVFALDTLTAGTYQLYYKSDEIHSYAGWNTPPPDRPELWGIQIYTITPQEAQDLAAALNAEPMEPMISDALINTLYIDSLGALWVGTRYMGLDKINLVTRELINYQSGDDPTTLSINNIMTIHKDQFGTVWIGTYWGGLHRFDRDAGGFKRYVYDPDKPHSISHNIISSIYESRFGTEDVLWIGTQGGLNKLNRKTETFTHYREKDGLPSDFIRGILEDDHGNLWISTTRGLSKFNPHTETFKNYDISDGLQGYEFHVGSCYQSPNGEMFFGGRNGFNAFYPDSIVTNTYLPPVVITDFSIYDESAQKKINPISVRGRQVEKIKLSYRERVLSFQFSALNYINSAMNQYKYKMDGFDEDWIYAGTRRFVTYTNLDPGEYTFCVAGSNNDGLWNEEGASVRIIITPPFWKTPWFTALSILLLLTLVLIGYKRRLKNVRMKTELRAAHNAQMSIMPQADPELEGMTLSGVCLPANEVGGDFFDYIWLDKDKTKLCVAVGDVSGKAMTSAITAILSSGMIYSHVSGDIAIQEIMTRLNHLMYTKTDKSMFTALCLSSLDLQTKQLIFTNAGLNEPLLKSDGVVSCLDSIGPKLPLGGVQGTQYEERMVQLKKKDVLVFFTDGITDAKNHAKNFYEESSLIQLLQNLETAKLSAREIREIIIKDVQQFMGATPQYDDMTVVVLKCET